MVQIVLATYTPSGLDLASASASDSDSVLYLLHSRGVGAPFEIKDIDTWPKRICASSVGKHILFLISYYFFFSHTHPSRDGGNYRNQQV